MKKISTTLLVLGSAVLFSQKVSWQKNIESNTRDFLSGLAITIDGQYLVSGNISKLVIEISLNINPLKIR